MSSLVKCLTLDVYFHRNLEVLSSSPFTGIFWLLQRLNQFKQEQGSIEHEHCFDQTVFNPVFDPYRAARYLFKQNKFQTLFYTEMLVV
jgi:hypothetical protein